MWSSPRRGRSSTTSSVRRADISGSRLHLVEFPADDTERARGFWEGLLGEPLDSRGEREGEGWQTRSSRPVVGIHSRGRGPGDSFSLPYFEVADLPGALAQVKELGGSVVHPGEAFAVCRDSEGSPFGLAARSAKARAISS